MLDTEQNKLLAIRDSKATDPSDTFPGIQQELQKQLRVFMTLRALNP